MRLKIKTTVLKEMVGRAVKGAGNNKLLPLTGMISIKEQNDRLVLTTSDGTNYLYILQDKIEMDEGFEVVVQVEQFGKLVSKLTCESVEMVIANNALEVRGNGTYRIDIPLDEEGENITYPDPFVALELNQDAKQIQLSTIRTILESCKASLAQTLEVPCYTGYYCGDNVVATDNNKIASLNVRLFDTDVLVPPEVMNLLDVMTCEQIDVNVLEEYLVFTSPDCIVVGMPMDGIEEYPIEPITEFVETDMESTCSINKNALLSLLERIDLFVGAYDDHAIRLTFTKDGINVESMQSNGVEVIPYITSENYKPFTCLIDITFLLAEIKSVAADAIKMQYGADNAIKFKDGNLTIIIALLADDGETE